jgi:esterase/lipase superfamily enzyme
MAFDIGKILLQQKAITVEQLRRGHGLKGRRGGSLSAWLVEMGAVTEDQIVDAVSQEFRVPAIKLDSVSFDEQLAQVVPLEVARRHRVLPLSKEGRTLTIVTADPTDVFALDDIKFTTGLDVALVVSTESAIDAAIKKVYGEGAFVPAAELESVAADVEEAEPNEDDRRYDDLESDVDSSNLPANHRAKSPGNYSIVKVFYATDRQATGDQTPAKRYGNKRSKDEGLTFGTCEVSIPRDHKLAHIERPSWRNLFREDPARHVVVLSVSPLASQSYFDELSSDVRSSEKRQVLVFIHGFDVTFEEGAWRTAQLAYDLGFDGPPILYSWPSKGHLHDYTVDETTMEWSVPHLKQLLSEVCARAGAQIAHVIAHSMGNRILVNALKEIALSSSAGAPALVHEVILTAPDVDTGVFLQTAELIQKAAARITLYASANDKALEASKRIHGGPRAGDSGDGIVVFPQIETIDASGVDTSFVGHSYYGDNRSVLSDIFYLLRDGLPASKRFGMRQMSIVKGLYWAFVP